MEERFLVVGLGSIGRRHAANLHRLRPGCRVAALRSATGRSTETPNPDVCRHFHDWQDALAFAPSAAIVCNPASHHLEAARILLDAGVPMLIEKPIADTTAGLRAFAEKVRDAGLPVAVGYNLRFSRALAHARQLVQEGAIGDVLSARAEVGQYLPDWRPQSRYQDGVSARRALGGGPLLELSHEIDYLVWMFGMPEKVSAVGARLSGLDIDVEDAVELTLIHDKPKRLMNVHLDFLQRAPDRRCRLIGSEGTLIWDAMRDAVDLYRVSTGEWTHFHLPPQDRNEVYLDEMSAFLQLMSGKPAVLAGLEEACDVLAIVEAAASSMSAGTVMRVHGCP